MHVADDVERSLLGLAIVPQRLAFDRHFIDGFLLVEHVNMAEALAVQRAKRATQILNLVSDYVWTEASIRARPVAIDTHALRQIQYDRNGKHMVFTSECYQRLP